MRGNRWACVRECVRASEGERARERTRCMAEIEEREHKIANESNATEREDMEA